MAAMVFSLMRCALLAAITAATATLFVFPLVSRRMPGSSVEKALAREVEKPFMACRTWLIVAPSHGHMCS